MLLLIVAVVVIYLVLGILYESFLHPITILSALPFAGFGALLTLLLFNVEPVDLRVRRHDHADRAGQEERHHDGRLRHRAAQARATPVEAIYEACLIRFRPIMMTTMAALMAGLPIALGYGAGAERRRPLGLAVVGGLLFSQSLTLYVTPVFYVYMEKLAGLFKARADQGGRGRRSRRLSGNGGKWRISRGGPRACRGGRHAAGPAGADLRPAGLSRPPANPRTGSSRPR